MRIPVLAVVLASCTGAAMAGDPVMRADANDYTGQVYYRVDFGGPRLAAQSVGLRFDQDRAAARGAPALFQASLGTQGAGTVAVNGLDLRGAMIANQATDRGGLTAGQWVGIGFTALVFAAIAVEAADSDDEVPPTGTGAGS